MKTLFKWFVALSGILVLLVGAWAYSNWQADRPVDSLKAKWAKAPSVFVDIAGMQVHVRDEGPRDDPEPIVLIHGTSASLHTWEGWTQSLLTLPQARRVVRLDLPGFGLTGPNPSNDYSFTAYANFMKQFLDHMKIERAVLAGNSLGGAVAWSTAHAHPAKVTKLILLDSAGYDPASASKPPSIPLGFQIARMPGFRELLGSVLPRSIIESSLKNVYGDPSKVTSALVEQYFEIALRAGNRKALGRRMDQGYTGNPDHIRQIKQPTLILWGAQDRLIAPEFAERFAKDIAGSKLVVFEKLGHVPHEEDPVASFKPVRKFLGQ